MAAIQHQQHYQQHDDPHLDTIDAPVSWQPRLTSSSLRELRRSDDPAQTTQPISPMMSRRTSLDSDRVSTVSGLTSYFPNNPTNVNPGPSYVAPFGASQVVSELLASKREPSSDDEEDENLNKDDVHFTEPALALINAFLDQLLYSFLSTARSTSLLALRPAVTEVLKHRLAREAIASAEEELAELLAGGDDEEDTKHKMAEDSRRWDLELVWKRTRLRVMVYMRLGEMEDEDEQRYVKEEELFHGSERRFSQTSGLVSWAAAIFLTSVLEYVAEQTLQVSGQAAYTRARRQSRTQRLAGMDVQTNEALVVEEYDVEKVALNSTLGRLWRTWRKALRNNTTPSTPTHRSSLSMGRASRDNTVSSMSHRHNSSFGTAHEGESRPMSRDEKDQQAEMVYPEHVLAANIPLPIGDGSRDIDEIMIPGLARDVDAETDEADSTDVPYAGDVIGSLVPIPISDEKRDVDEIEVPGLARDPDVKDDSETPLPSEPKRRNSFAGVGLQHFTSDMLIPETSSSTSPTQASMPPTARQRSRSLPHTGSIPMLEEEKQVEEQEQGPEDTPGEQHRPENETHEDVPAKVEQATGKTEAERIATDRSKTEFPWMAGGAAAASGAAASAWALSSKKSQSEQAPEETAQDRDVVQSTARSSSNRGFGGLIESANQDDGSRERITRPRLLDVQKESSQRSLSDKDIEELDKRKSLIDIKAMMVVNGPSGPTSGQESPEKAQTPTLERGLSAEGVSKEVGTDDAIGVVRPAEMPAALAPRVEETSSPGPETQEAREAGKRPPRLILDDSTNVDSQQAQPPTPGTLQRQFLDLTSETQAPESQDEQARSASGPSQRASLSNGAQQSPSLGSSPYRQSFAAPVEKDGSAVQPKQGSESQLQEHPVVQRMANSKGSEPKSPRSPKLVNDPDKPVPLTSASIRGPEDFDMFVQGDDTVKYTLTPETVREEPVSYSNACCIRCIIAYITQVLDATPYPKAGGSPVEMDAASHSRAGRSHAQKEVTSTTAEQDFQNSKRRSISRPSPRTAVPTKSGLMAREPRVMTESTRDFADFIRSTGPGKESTVYPILANASTTSLHSLRSAHINGASASRSSSPGPGQSRTSLRPGAEGPMVPPVPPIPRKTKSRTSMQPRGATSVSGGSAELIDFIRSGPDQHGKHRISRTVAPFRNTMDSDQFKDFDSRMSTDRALDPRLNTIAPSVQSTSSMVSSAPRTSANSRSALLNGGSNANQTVQPAYSGQPQSLSQGLLPVPSKTGTDENEPMRKRHRNKDPYAMYYDDDDDEDLLTSLPKTTRREESLVDFLNNNAPPPDNSPRPIINPNSAQARNIINNARANGVGSQRPVSVTDGRARTIPNPTGPRSGYASPSQSMYSARSTTINSSVTGPLAGGSKMQARGGARDIAMNSNTKELADFFKSSGPDPESAPAPSVGRDSKLIPKEAEKAKKKAEKKRSGGFFSRNKKKTYLDMT